MEKSEITVRTKARELIGRLSIVLWIYCQAFKIVRSGKPLRISTKVTKEYVKFAEEIVSVSYAHSETFSTVSNIILF